jgi:hypothetical protein
MGYIVATGLGSDRRRSPVGKPVFIMSECMTSGRCRPAIEAREAAGCGVLTRHGTSGETPPALREVHRVLCLASTQAKPDAEGPGAKRGNSSRDCCRHP